MRRRILRKLLKGLGWFALIIVVIAVILIGIIDRTPLSEQSFYTQMMAKLDSLQPAHYPANSNTLATAWDKANITPEYPMPMAGYNLRPAFESVHDSIFARIVIVDNGNIEAVLVSADMLIFPPALKQALEQRLQSGTKPMFLYYSATHTHSSVGGWHPGKVTQLAFGDYNQQWIDHTASAIEKKVNSLRQQLLPSHLYYWQTEAKEYAINRLKSGNPYDGKLRGLKISRADSTQAYLVTYSAHATSISSKSTALSGDYPAEIIKHIENKSADFAMFMAGMVGSHRLSGIAEREFERTAKAGELLADKVLQPDTIQELTADLKAAHIPIVHGKSQFRFTKNLKLRNWAFREAMNPLEGELTYLQIGNTVLIGTPCDFSGEILVTQQLEESAASHQKHLIITSFNGAYTGYITEDSHYETNLRAEVTSMNWVGPYFGAYYTDMINKLLEK